MKHKTYQIIKGGKGDALHEAIPEYINGEKLIPDETYVLVGYCRSPEQYRWIEKLRNTTLEWALEMDHYYWISKQSILNIYYFIIKEMCLPVIFGKITSRGPKVYSRKNLEKIGYPQAEAEKDYSKFYLVIDIEKVSDPEFQEIEWKFKDFDNFKSKNASAWPFTASLSEIMKCRVKR